MLNKTQTNILQSIINNRLVFSITIRKHFQLSLQWTHPNILDKEEEYTSQSSITRAETKSQLTIHETYQDGDSRVKKYCLVVRKVHLQSLISSSWLQRRHRSSPTITIRNLQTARGKEVRSHCMTSKIHKIEICRQQMLCSQLQQKACYRGYVRSR